MALNNHIAQRQLEATRAHVDFMYSCANMTPLPVWLPVFSASDDLEQDVPALGGGDDKDGDGMCV